MKRKVLFVMLVLSVFTFCLTLNVQAQQELDWELLSKSVVRIYNTEKEIKATGFFIDEDKIVTNHHVVSSHDLSDDWTQSAVGNTVTVVYSLESNDFIDGIVIEDWPNVDLAIVQVEKGYTKREPLSLLDPNEIYVGMDILLAGFPAIGCYLCDDLAVTKTIIRKINNSAQFLETTVPFVKLNIDYPVGAGAWSGSPIIDEHGHVVGIYYVGTDGIGFGISVGELEVRLNARGYSYTKVSDK